MAHHASAFRNLNKPATTPRVKTMTSQVRDQSESQDSNPSSIRFGDIFDRARRWKWQLLGCLSLSLAVGVVHLMRADTFYHVTARLLVEQRESPLEQGRRSRKDEEFLATQAEIIRSPAVVRRAVLALQDSQPVALEQEGNPAVSVLESLSVTPVVGTSVLSIGLLAPNERDGVRTVEAIIDSYREYLQESARNSHVEALRIFTQSERELRTDLESAQQEYQSLREASPLMDQGREVQQRLLAELGQALAEARSRRVEFQNRMGTFLETQSLELASRDADQAAATTSPVGFRRAQTFALVATNHHAALAGRAKGEEVLNALTQVVSFLPKGGGQDQFSDLALMVEELFRARVREGELSQRLGPKHNEMKAIRAQIAAWEQRLGGAVDAAPAMLQKQLGVLQRHEEQLETLCTEEFEKVKSVDLHLLKEQQSLDGIQRVQSLHDSIQHQLRAWQMNDQALANGQSSVNLTVLQSPGLSDDPIRPPSSALLAVFALVGLVGGLGAITVLERIDPRVRSAAVQDRLSLPVLGQIPKIPRHRDASEASRSRYVHRTPDSAIANAFRALCARLDHGASQSRGFVIQIASPSPGAGKSTIAANLAFSFAQLGRRVLVVDANLRDGSLHEVFEVPNQIGLTDMLRDGLPPESAIHRSPLTAVDVLPRGSDRAHPGELLTQSDPSCFLDSLRSKYDVVLLDAPALLASTEAFVLGPKVDRIIMSVSVGHTLVADAARARDLLESLDTNIAGIVVNRSS